MLLKKRIASLYQEVVPVTPTLGAVDYTISTYGVQNIYHLGCGVASVLIMPNVVECEGCEFLFIPGTLTGGLTIKDDAGNTLETVATSDAPFMLKSTGLTFPRFDEDTDT